jgi:hypothetical protein
MRGSPANWGQTHDFAELQYRTGGGFIVYHEIARGKNLTPACPPHEKVEKWGLKLTPQVLSGCSDAS